MRKKNCKQVEDKSAVLSDGTPVKDGYMRWLIDDEHDRAKNFANLGKKDFIFLWTVPYVKE